MSNIITAGNATNNGTSISSDTSGVLELKTGSTPTTALTIDASQIVSIPKGVGGTPAFSAYPSTGQTISSATWTKINLGTEIFDTNSNFASGRFTPTVAGYYQINGRFGNGGSATEVIAAIYKNGSAYAYGSDNTLSFISTVCDVVYLNGSTDYVELYGFLLATTAVSSAQERTLLSGSLVRAA